MRRQYGRAVNDMFSIFPLILTTLTLSPDLIISGQRIEQGVEAPVQGVLISPASWILLRSYLDTDRCTRAVDACATGCEEQIALILEECRGRESPDDDLVIAALHGELDTERKLNENLMRQNTFLKWSAIGAGVMLISVGTIIYITR